MTDMTVRSVDGDPWSFEGLMIPYGGPMNGRDLTGTRFTQDTDFCLGWNQTGIYPLLMEHGFDGATKTDVVGRWSFRAWDDKGGWAQGKLDEAYEYATDIRGLMDQGALRFSSGAVDHLYDFDPKSGAIKLWPLVEGSLVTRPANPDQPAVRSIYAVKSAESVAHFNKIGILAAEKSLGEIPQAALGVGSQGSAGVDPSVTMSVLVPDDILEAMAPQKPAQIETASGARLRDLKKTRPFSKPGEGDPDDSSSGISDVGDVGGDQGGGDGGGGAGLSLGVPAPKAVAVKDVLSALLANISTAIAALSAYAEEEAAEGDDSGSIAQPAMETALAADDSGVFTPAYASIKGAPMIVGESGPESIALRGNVISGRELADVVSRELYQKMSRASPASVKAGARNSASDLTHIQSIHDSAASLGADCYGSGKSIATPPASVLAIKAGDDVVPVSADDLADIGDRFAEKAGLAVRRALGLYD